MSVNRTPKSPVGAVAPPAPTPSPATGDGAERSRGSRPTGDAQRTAGTRAALRGADGIPANVQAVQAVAGQAGIGGPGDAADGAADIGASLPARSGARLGATGPEPGRDAGSARSAAGPLDPKWRQRFDSLLDDVEMPAEQKAQVMQQLESGGLDEQQLQQAYDEMDANRPAWNDHWEDKFQSLDIPEEMLTQLKESGAPEQALDQQFQHLLDVKMKYYDDGRLDELLDADATSEEKWGVMLEDMEGEDYDQALEGIKSAHVSGWQRMASIGVNLIPGVYAAQYLTGKDWITGETIDRSNPLNAIGAIGSGFAGFSAIRGAVSGVQGLQAANSAFKAGTASSGLTSAAESANLLPKMQKGLGFLDYAKAATPVVNRFGEAGRLSALGRGYSQSMQLAAGSAALRSTAGGGVAVDGATKSTVLSELRQGKTIESALGTAGRNPTGTAGGFALRAEDVARDANRYGFLQGGTGRVVTGSGNFRFNPFKNQATIASTANPNVMSLGRNVNFGSSGGLAQGLGVTKGANIAASRIPSAANALPEGANPLITNPRNASKMGGLDIADDAVRAQTAVKTAEWARKLGVTDGGRLQQLTQLGSSNRAAARVAGLVEHGGSKAYRGARIAGQGLRSYAGMAAMPIVGGSVVGMSGKQMQPGWEYLKHIKEIKAEESKAKGRASKERAELERLYREEQMGGTGGTADAAAAAGAMPAASPAPVAAPAPAAPGMAPAPTGGVYQDPTTGFYVDPATGMMVDPTSGTVFDPTGAPVGNVADMQQPAVAG